MKTTLVILALALITCLVVIASPSRAPHPSGVSGASGGPAFVVDVLRPWSARPLFGLLPGSELHFDQASAGATVGNVSQNRLELSADGWELIIETDGDGNVAPGTHLVFPIELAERLRKLRGLPAENAVGYLRVTPRPDSDECDGQFLIELAHCEDVETGKTLEWPPAPLTLRGSFTGLRPGPR